ncbi:LexA family transcriptional regulator [Legionella septentrionalis]|uniref:LexA family transcriptional regulator n=1 Tax=Legionella septentrionalis TaxID=2498109 RepID=UPI000F8C645A|nr:LexA family transcriptional regulator [Legionella septentrionalis]RUQ96643.1 LexA family transcriptional regulator [Legionella septentrionalis]
MTEICSPQLTEVSKILKKLITSFDNISGSELAKRCGVPVSTINRILAGTVIDPKISTLKPLADYFAISVDQLLGYAALPEKFDRKSQSLKPTMALPVFKLKNFQSISQKPSKWFTWVSERQAQDDTFAISIDTEEFEPVFAKDSVLIIEPSMQPPQDNDYVALIFENENIIAIRRYRIDGQDHYFVPLNPQFKAVLCSEKKYNLLGVISEAHTKLRDI